MRRLGGGRGLGGLAGLQGGRSGTAHGRTHCPDCPCSGVPDPWPGFLCIQDTTLWAFPAKTVVGTPRCTPKYQAGRLPGPNMLPQKSDSSDQRASGALGTQDSDAEQNLGVAWAKPGEHLCTGTCRGRPRLGPVMMLNCEACELLCYSAVRP